VLSHGNYRLRLHRPNQVVTQDRGARTFSPGVGPLDRGVGHATDNNIFLKEFAGDLFPDPIRRTLIGPEPKLEAIGISHGKPPLAYRTDLPWSFSSPLVRAHHKILLGERSLVNATGVVQTWESAGEASEASLASASGWCL
jgi:hypothetical protein